ncbi:MAG: polysaccharide deacetylase family protein [bacterium]|nr:polysaccharide deacetylase family protein [bacterium]
MSAFPILMYHGLWPAIDSPAELTRHWAADPQMRDPGARLYALDHRVFERHMQHIAASGRPTLRRWADLDASPASATRAPVWITFDDGHRSNLALACPTLLRLGLGAIFFITTDWIGREGFMTADDLRELRRAGMLIGAHGCSHRYFSDLPLAEVRREMADSKARLEDLLGEGVTAMSLPGGRNRRRLRHLAREAGYRHLFTSAIGLARPGGDPFDWPRIPLTHRLADEFIPRLLAGDARAVDQMARKAAVLRLVQITLGNRFYDYLRARVLRRRMHSPLAEAAGEPPFRKT